MPKELTTTKLPSGSKEFFEAISRLEMQAQIATTSSKWQTIVANYALKPTQAIAKTVMCRQSEIWMIHIERKLKKILQQVCIRPASIKTKMGTIIHILKVVVNGQKS